MTNEELKRRVEIKRKLLAEKKEKKELTEELEEGTIKGVGKKFVKVFFKKLIKK